MAQSKKTRLVITSERVVDIDLGEISPAAIAAGLGEHGAFGVFGDYYIGGDVGDEVSDDIVRITLSTSDGKVLFDSK